MSSEGPLPVSIASKCLTTTEINYSIIERKMLGVIFLSVYLWEAVITDNKPLGAKSKKSLSEA